MGIGLLIKLLFGYALPALAAIAPATVLQQDVNYLGLASSNIYSGNFTTDPTTKGQVLAETDEEEERVSIFLINRRPCIQGTNFLVYRLVIRNESQESHATNFTVKNTYPPNVTVIDTQPGAVVNVGQREIEWSEPTALLPPNSFREYLFTFSLQSPSQPFTNVATVEYTMDGAQKVSTTSHTIDGTCNEVPDVPVKPRPTNKFAAIICDISEVGCNTVLPALGVNFERAQEDSQQPRVCSGQEHRGSADCVDQLPTLGTRFGQAKPTIVPGDCSVREDVSTIEGYDPTTAGPPVEITVCESNGYPEFVIRGAPEPVKARQGTIALPDTSDLDGTQTVINPQQVSGSACSGRPGDPWWAADCSCTCNSLLAVQEGRIVPCQGVKPITRGDIFVTSPQECAADTGHADPFF
ncbi:MAG: hypothetical protein WEC84_02540 [Candidatus Andersenbacteria bacterium]